MNAKPQSPKIETLKKRDDFLRLRRARAAKRPAFILQAAQNESASHSDQIRVGYTCSKKIGNAVIRNRAKRRLRAVAATILPQYGRSGWDYVFIGRSGATEKREFAKILREAQYALQELHEGAK